MDFSLNVSAAPHRLWYIAGDVVKMRLSLTCVPEVTLSKRKQLAPLKGASTHNYFSIDSSEMEAQETDVRVAPVEAELVGFVEVDTSVMRPVSWPAAVSEQGPPGLSRADSSRSKVVYRLYSTGKKLLREEVHLRRYECTALEFTLRLPEGCPPTFKGRGADYRHDVTISAAWYAVRSSSTAKAPIPHISKVRVPLIVFNSVATTAQLPLMSLFPLLPHSTLVAEGFHFQAAPLASVPTPSMAAPLTDVMLPHEAQMRTSLTVRHDAKARSQSSLATRRQPLSFIMPCKGVDLLQVHLHSCCVSLGDYLQGAFNLLETSPGPDSTTANQRMQRSQDAEAPVPVSVTISLELLECVTPEWALTVDDANVMETKQQGMENFVCTHRRVIDCAQLCVLDTPCVPFEFSLPVGLVPASTITDMTSFLWQLRVVMMAVPRRALAQASSPGVDWLGPLLEPVAAVFPLVVTPPSVPSKTRQGAVW
ncbi:hypothetical protein LSCM1_02430 [Leishmania martiniquensis]|uniref:Arrestin-like N-terminal domain-containing protein n=1 Tax=Leishmania martiniquensis TaxID=1580590 RepID=A0A836GMT8_9TRYP|nr:hypothetical protein LSCM1_02430 [Leishmania martiniquensis]